MIRLIGVEFRRFLSRRLFRVVTVLILAGFSIGGIAAYLVSDNSPEAMAGWKAEKAAEVDSCVVETEARIAANIDDISDAAREDPRQFCRKNTWVEQPSFQYRHLQWMLLGFALPLMILGWLFGASFVGAEWHNRTMTTLLTWEPRRLRVLAAKAIAASLIVFLWVVAFQAVAALAFYPAAELEGTMAGVDSDWWRQLGETVLRSGALGSMTAMFGLALSTIGRNTAAALGVGFGYFAVLESLIRNFKSSWMDWLLGPNVALVLNGPEESLGHSQGAGALLLVAYASAALVLAALVFRRRDIA